MSDDKELDALVAKVAAVHELDDCNSDTYMLLLHLSDAITALRLSLSKMTEARDFVVGLHSQACREACALRAALEECGFTGSLPEGEYDRLVRERDEARGWEDSEMRAVGAERRAEAAEARVAEVESAMRDWTICFHCGARFLDAEGEAHGRTCEKSPQRKLEAALAASEARVKRLRGFLASAESLILGDETRTKTAEAWLDDARAALRLLACVPLVALVVAAIATAPIAGVMSFLIGFATVIALAAIIAAFLWGVGVIR